MSSTDWIQLIVFLAIVFACAPFLGKYLARVFDGEKHFLSFLAPLERGIYRVTGVNPQWDMNWKQYAAAVLAFNAFGFLSLMALLMTQGWLPLNPAHIPSQSWHLAFNTAVSFMTNTNWQSYNGEVWVSYLSQMTGLAVHNFLSAGTGMAVMLALFRGIRLRPRDPSLRGATAIAQARLGNFWVDLTRTTLYVFIPLAIILTVLLLSQGVVQNFAPHKLVVGLEGGDQILPMGPAASQIAIKQLGSNGGGFFGVNSAHPFENPTPLSSFLEMIAILLVPVSIPFAYGRMVKDRRQGRAIFAAKTILFALGLIAVFFFEFGFNGVTGGHGSMEGKEVRFGIPGSALWAEITTIVSNGSVNSMHDSFSPLGGMVPMVNIMLGEIIYGGIGAGMYGMLIFLVITIFFAGLMVGRTPEYLGKKIETREVQLSVLAVIGQTVSILFFAAAAVVLPAGLAGLNNQGPHGLSEILYAYSSTIGNNGSAFAGLTVNTPFYNVTLGTCMLIGRFVVIVPALALAGGLGAKTPIPPSVGTFSTHNATFVVLLVLTVLIVGALNFFPALTLGPVLEHFLALKGMVF